MFKNHHYLTGKISRGSRCWVGVWNNQVVCFGASIAMPNGLVKNAWRGHRTVVLPDFQGMGIGVAFSDMIAQMHVDDGYRYYSRTAHPRMGFHREHSELWKPTTKNRKLRKDIAIDNIFKNHYFDAKRICFSHEYVGDTSDH
jgi:GNAT superfamily N-acetyltransferase